MNLYDKGRAGALPQTGLDDYVRESLLKNPDIALSVDTFYLVFGTDNYEYLCTCLCTDYGLTTNKVFSIQSVFTTCFCNVFYSAHIEV